MQTSALASVTRLPRAKRAQIEERITRHLSIAHQLIGILDAIDAPFEDLEDDDPSGDVLEIHGEAPSDDGRPLYPVRPIYGIDQSAGPTNEHAAYRAHMLAAIGR